MGFIRRDIGIDLGTASVVIYVQGKGVVLREPSMVAVNPDASRLLAIGVEAKKMLGRTPGTIVTIRPLRDGVISDFDMAGQMLRAFIKKVRQFSILKPRLLIGIPTGITEVEERAVVEAALQAGAKKVYLVEEPLAAAIGAGLDIDLPEGRMVVDIGGGTADIVVISMGAVVVSQSIKVAGNAFDEAAMGYIRSKFGVLIGECTAETMKQEIGCVAVRPDPVSMEVKGRCAVTGLPRTIKVSSSDMEEAFRGTSALILDAIHSVLERTPPELAADLVANGIVFTGGGSLIGGLTQLVQEKTGIPARVAEDPVSMVALGIGKCLERLDEMEDGPLDLSRRRQTEQRSR